MAPHKDIIAPLIEEMTAQVESMNGQIAKIYDDVFNQDTGAFARIKDNANAIEKNTVSRLKNEKMMWLLVGTSLTTAGGVVILVISRVL